MSLISALLFRADGNAICYTNTTGPLPTLFLQLLFAQDRARIQIFQTVGWGEGEGGGQISTRAQPQPHERRFIAVKKYGKKEDAVLRPLLYCLIITHFSLLL